MQVSTINSLKRHNIYNTAHNTLKHIASVYAFIFILMYIIHASGFSEIIE